MITVWGKIAAEMILNKNLTFECDLKSESEIARQKLI